MGFRYQDYFDVQITDPAKRAEVLETLNWLATETKGEMLAIIQKAHQRYGTIVIQEGDETAGYIDKSLVEINFDQIASSRYMDPDGNAHPTSLKRALTHELGHMADENKEPFYAQHRAEIIRLKKEGLDHAQAGLPEEKSKRENLLTEAAVHPEAFSRSEAFDIMYDTQAVWHQEIYLLSEAEKYYERSDLYKLQKHVLERPIVDLENHIMQTYAGEPARASYESTITHSAPYREALLQQFYQYIDDKPFPVNPEPAEDLACSIPPDVLEKINRGEMTLAQAGITLDKDETLPDQHEGCLVVVPLTPISAPAPQGKKER